MKKAILTITLLTILVSVHQTFSQSTVANGAIGNQYAAGRFLGWGTTSGDLGIRTNNIDRITIKNTTGFVNVGNTFPNAQYLFNISSLNVANVNGNLFRTDGLISTNAGQNFPNVWTMYTGTGQPFSPQTEKFRLYAPAMNLYGAILPNSELDFGLQASQRHMFFETGGAVKRMWINGPSTRTIAGVANVNTTGFVGIGDHTGAFSALNPGSGRYNGPMSLLHLQGPNNTTFNGDWRKWMRTGIFISENSDNMYIGMKDESVAGTNYSDAVVGWGDDNAFGGGGPDDLRFIFNASGGQANGNGTGTNPNNPVHLNGREMMRMLFNGNIGIGPVFSKIPVATGSHQPQSTLHQHQENSLSSYMQITNQRMNQALANPNASTPINFNNGLRWGVLGDQIQSQNGNAFFYNQEHRHLIFSTGHEIPMSVLGGIDTMNERMRITHIKAPTNLPGGGYGVFNPGGYSNQDFTRIALSMQPSQPLTRPLSLLHLGYNYDPAMNFNSSTGGWRNWMDLGMFATNETGDHVFIGIRPDTSSLIPNLLHSDAVIGWGHDQDSVSVFQSSPDNLRFVFTAVPGTNNFSGNAIAKSNDGLEVGRFFPGRDTLGTYGRFGIGNFYTNGLNQKPTHKLDVEGNGRFRLLPDTLYRMTKEELDTLAKIVFVDTNGVLRWEWRDSLIMGGGITLGNICGAVKNPLDTNWEIPLNNHNYIFSETDSGTGKVGIGNIAVSCAPGNVLEVSKNSVTPSATGLSGLRLTDLRSGVTVDAPNGIVLSVDSSGDVIVVRDSVGAGGILGNICNTTPNPLPNNWEIPLGNKNFVFSDTSGGTGKVGIGNITTTCSPGNVLEVSKNGTTPNASGISGLRLTDLKTGAGTAAANGKVLSVNSSGDVILVNDQTGTGTFAGAQNGLNTSASGTGAVELGGTLIRNTTVDLGANNLNFTQLSGGSIGIGNGNTNTGQNNFYSGITNTLTGTWDFVIGNGNSSGSTNNIILGNLNQITATGGIQSALIGYQNKLTSGTDRVFIFGSNNTAQSNARGEIFGKQNIIEHAEGVAIGHQVASGGGSMSIGYGPFGAAANVVAAGYNINSLASQMDYPAINIQNNWVGIKTPVDPGTSLYVKGIILGTNATTGLKVDAGPTAGSKAAYFNGDVYVNGATNSGTGYLVASDQRFKTNISSLSNAMAILNQLNPKSFFYDTTNTDNIKFSSKKQYGFIAQETEMVLPEIVGEVSIPADLDSAGNIIKPSLTYKNLNYTSLHAIEIKAIQEMQAKINMQDSLINQLSSVIQSCCSYSNSGNPHMAQQNNITQIDVELSDKDAYFLGQNIPNPFADKTTINFNIPDFRTSAEINFYNNSGDVIKSVKINSKGKGQLNVSVSELANGMYSYSLVIDGSVKATKKMVKSE